MNGRIIAIGDIHGCHLEFAELLERLAPTPDDLLILVGDLVNRGPDSNRVIDLAIEHRAISLLGNHELPPARLPPHRRPPALSKTTTIVDRSSQLRPNTGPTLRKCSLTHESRNSTPSSSTVVSCPTSPGQKQPAERRHAHPGDRRRGPPRKRADCPEGRLWADRWNGPALRRLRPHSAPRHLPAQVVRRHRHRLRHGRPPHRLHPARTPLRPGQSPPPLLSATERT